MYLAPLNYDRFFKKVFSDPKIAKRFLEDFLEVEIEEFQMLEGKHRVTDDASIVEFDFRCKIEGSYVIIDMQQWYKRDIGKRFYLYHALNTGLQLEELPMQRIVLDRRTRKMKKAKDYRALEPVITLVWMAMDSLGFDLDYVSYIMAPEIVMDFINNEHLWLKSGIVALFKERERLLQVIKNENKDLDFLPKNRLIFLLQKNIVKNKVLKKYEKWFEFAEKTRDQNNKEEDFTQYAGDEIFSEMIRRLTRADLSDDDVGYIEEEKTFWEEVGRLENGIFEDGIKKGEKIGIEKGEKIGIEKGEKIGVEKVALNMLNKGMTPEDVSELTGLSLDKVKTLLD